MRIKLKHSLPALLAVFGPLSPGRLQRDFGGAQDRLFSNPLNPQKKRPFMLEPREVIAGEMNIENVLKNGKDAVCELKVVNDYSKVVVTEQGDLKKFGFT